MNQQYFLSWMSGQVTSIAGFYNICFFFFFFCLFAFLYCSPWELQLPEFCAKWSCRSCRGSAFCKAAGRILISLLKPCSFITQANLLLKSCGSERMSCWVRDLEICPGRRVSGMEKQFMRSTSSYGDYILLHPWTWFSSVKRTPPLMLLQLKSGIPESTAKQ